MICLLKFDNSLILKKILFILLSLPFIVNPEIHAQIPEHLKHYYTVIDQSKDFTIADINRFCEQSLINCELTNKQRTWVFECYSQDSAKAQKAVELIKEVPSPKSMLLLFST